MFGIDLRSLAVMRIGLGLLVLVDLFQRCTDIKAHYSDYGVMPRTLLTDRVIDSPWCSSLYLISGATPVVAALMIIAAAVAVCLLIGYRTRIATIASWVLLLSLHYRNPMILQGGDVLFRMLLFFGMFLPLGARWSVDAAATRRMTGDQRPVLTVASVALLLQIAYMYDFSVFLKTDPVWREDFSAVYCALSLSHFVRPLGLLLLPHAQLLKWMTVGTLVIEGLGPPLAFLAGAIAWPLRLLAVLAMMSFHATMGLTMQLGLFSFICWTAWAAFLPPGFWNWLERIWSRRAPHALSDLSTRATKLALRLPRWNADSSTATFSLTASRANQFIALFFILYITLWNLRTVNFDRWSRVFPTRVNWVGWLTGTCQVWDMFAPGPLREGGWFVMPAQLADGSEVDLWRDGRPVNWDKPPLISAMYKNDRWRKYMVVYASASSSNRRLPFAQWLAARWNNSHPAGRQILTFQIYLMLQKTLPNYEADPPHPMLLWMHDCRPQQDENE